jgi:hypothetical protein
VGWTEVRQVLFAVAVRMMGWETLTSQAGLRCATLSLLPPPVPLMLRLRCSCFHRSDARCRPPPVLRRRPRELPDGAMVVLSEGTAAGHMARVWHAGQTAMGKHKSSIPSLASRSHACYSREQGERESLASRGCFARRKRGPSASSSKTPRINPLTGRTLSKT